MLYRFKMVANNLFSFHVISIFLRQKKRMR